MDEDTKTEMKRLVVATMREQQTSMLQSAATNAEKIAEQKIVKTSSELKDVIDNEVAGSSRGEIAFKNNINKSNFDFCRQVDDMWKKTERAIAEKNEAKAKEFITKGKKQIKKRMKALRLADKEGWDVALAHLSDEMASNSEDEKRLKKARSSAKASRDGKKKRARSSSMGQENDRKWGKSSEEYGEKRGRSSYAKSNYRTYSGTDSKTCWTCGRLGHISPECPFTNNYSRK